MEKAAEKEGQHPLFSYTWTLYVVYVLKSNLLIEILRALRHGEEEQQEQQEQQEHQVEEGRGRIILFSNNQKFIKSYRKITRNSSKSFQITRNSSGHAEITRISLKSFQKKKQNISEPATPPWPQETSPTPDASSSSDAEPEEDHSDDNRGRGYSLFSST